MAPSKANLVMERRKSDVLSEGDAEGPGVLGGLTTALSHLSLHPDTPPKDLAKLEDHLSQITLDDTQTQEEDFKRHKEEEEEKEEAEPHKKRETEEEDLKRQEEEEEEEKETKSETEEEEEEEDKIRKESEQSEAEEEEEEKATVNATKEKGELVEEKKPSEGKILQEGKEEKDSTEKDDKEEEEEEEEEDGEEESDDENPTDEEINAQARKQKLRSRGLMHQGVGHGYAPSSHLDYQGFQQQPQQQQILYQQPPLASHQIGLSSPQYGEAAGYAGASPTHSGARGEMWYSGGVQLETECGTSLFPSLAEGSPASICSSADSDSQHLAWGYGPLDSPQSQYQDGNAPCYAQPCQGSPYTQYQASPSGQYQPSPPHYPDNGLPQYANYQDPLDAGCQDQGYQDHGYQTSPFLDGACMGTLVHSAPALSSLSPSIAETRTEGKGNQLDYICEALETVIKDNELGIPHDEKRIIEIKKSLLDIKQVHSLREGLDEEKYREYYGACAILIDENFVEPDEDGDIKIMLAASQGQAQPGYEERLVAMTERVQNINLCCNTVVDWHVNRCCRCGNTNQELFYSPLSWINNYGQMVLSNVVSEMYPVLVVQYLTKKIMQRPMDLQRTFTKHYQLFFNNQEVYKCLTQPLRMVETMQMQHTEHGTTR